MKTQYNIVVAEDSPIVQHLVSVSLQRRFNCQINCCATSNEVIRILQYDCPDILILDYYLGSFTERDYADRILDFTEMKRIYIPIIFFTSLEDKFLKTSFYERGVYDIVSKNSDNFLEELNTSVGSVMNWIKIQG
jgi:CheY-like chemotaxis protein